MSKARPRKKRPPGYVTPALGSAPDPRVNPDNPDYGKRRVDRLVITDTDGNAWDFVGDRPPVKLPRPPEES